MIIAITSILPKINASEKDCLVKYLIAVLLQYLPCKYQLGRFASLSIIFLWLIHDNREFMIRARICKVMEI